MNFELLSTEQVNEKSIHLDSLSIEDAVALMNKMDTETVSAVEKAVPQIAHGVKVIADRFKKGGRLIYTGAGTSGRLGVLDASECPPTFGVDPQMVVGMIAGGDAALRFAIEGAEDNAELGKEDMMKINIGEKDVLVAISASGYAPYCIGAIEYAKTKGAYTMGLVCNKGSNMSRHADHMIEVVTGPEILSGSTRLKAGTATKMVLNMLTTLSMVQIGKVYKNLMVDLNPTNIKLTDRAIRIVQNAIETDDKAYAKTLLEKAQGNVKAAIVMEKTKATYSQASKALEENKGYVRQAILALQ